MTREDLKRMVNEQSNNFYYQVLVIPEGALNIEIRQPGHIDDNDYIAIKGESGQNLLNGDNSVTNFPRKFAYGGVIFQYNGANQSVEMVTSTYAQKLTKKLIVEILTVKRISQQNLRQDRNDLLQFTYTIAKSHPSVRDQFAYNSYTQNYPSVVSAADQRFGGRSYHPINRKSIVSHSPKTPNYQWKMSEWSDCDKLCYGRKKRAAACIQLEASLNMPLSYCPAHLKPADEYEECNTECKIRYSRTILVKEFGLIY